MWFYGMEHASEKLTTGGRLSSEILQRSDALYWQSVHQGAEWEIISALVPGTWKHFASLASSAANSAQQVSQGETDLQVCKKIASTWQAGVAGKVMTFQEMRPILLRSKPPRTETIPHLFSFMMKCHWALDAGHGKLCEVQWHLLEEASSASVGLPRH